MTVPPLPLFVIRSRPYASKVDQPPPPPFPQVPGVVNILRVLPAAGPDIWDPTLTTDLDGMGHTEAYVNYDDVY